MAALVVPIGKRALGPMRKAQACIHAPAPKEELLSLFPAPSSPQTRFK